MRNFNYQALVEPGQRTKVGYLMNQLAAIEPECLHPCRDAFVRNMDRLFAIAELPAELHFSGLRTTFALVKTLAGLGRAIPDTVEELCASMDSSAFVKRFLAEMERSHDAEVRHRTSVAGIEMTATRNPDSGAQMDALLTSIVVESWMFFEALAGDLWCAAVDNQTPAMAHRLEYFNDWNKPDENFKTKDAERLEFSAKKQPGSFRREVGKVSFTKLGDIIKFYKAAFGDSIMQAFDGGAGGYIYALAAFRNCIVHRGGIVDHEFKKKVGRFPEFRGWKVGDPINLDGLLVRKLRDAASLTGAALLVAVAGHLNDRDARKEPNE